MHARLLRALAALLPLLACRPSGAAPAEPTDARTVEAPAAKEVLWDGHGLGQGWQDYGWAPRDLKPGQPASLDLSNYGGWIVAHPGLTGSFGGLRLRYRAPAGHPDFLEVRVDSSLAFNFPRVRVRPAHRRALPEGWTEAYVPMAELDPKGQPFDRVVLRAAESVPAERVQLAEAALTGGEAGAVLAEGSPLPAAPARPVRLTVQCRAKAQPISPLIYGIAFKPDSDAKDGWLWELGATARRWGGNPASRYNWELGNAWNTASDWYFKNVDYTGIPGFDYRRFLEDDLSHGTSTALTVPTLGWVAKDTKAYGFPVSKFGKQQSTAPEDREAGNGVGPDGTKLKPGSPTLTSVPAPPDYVGKWVAAIRAQDKERGKRAVHQYILDNEPALWNSTHRDVHPDPLTYDELLDRTVSYATAVRKADPEAVIAGPAEWGWPAYQYSALDAEVGFSVHPDRLRHGNAPLIPWLLRKLREHQKKTGVRLLDVLDVHFYPQGKNIGVGAQGGTDADTNALRLRSTRALWDPSYVDESWIKEAVRLLPRLHEWVDENAPGMGISLGEWNFGAEGHMSGGLAVAEALGRFGQNGVTSAFYWTYPARRSPAYWAFRAYRNYDGKGAHFLDQSEPAISPDPMTSVFASRDASGRQVLVLLNLDPAAPAKVNLELDGCTAPQSASAWTYSGGEAGFAAGNAGLEGGALHPTLPPYSITVLELKP